MTVMAPQWQVDRIELSVAAMFSVPFKLKDSMLAEYVSSHRVRSKKAFINAIGLSARQQLARAVMHPVG